MTPAPPPVQQASAERGGWYCQNYPSCGRKGTSQGTCCGMPMVQR